MTKTQKIALITFFITFTSTIVFASGKLPIVPKPEENSLQFLGDSEFCEKSYDKCADACVKKSKTEKQYDLCMEACEESYDNCYEQEAIKREEAAKSTKK